MPIIYHWYATFDPYFSFKNECVLFAVVVVMKDQCCQLFLLWGFKNFEIPILKIFGFTKLLSFELFQIEIRKILLYML